MTRANYRNKIYIIAMQNPNPNTTQIVPPMTPRTLQGIQDIIGKYDLAIIDQWGVLHNGVVPFAGAVEAISALHHGGTKIIILSNSGKLAKHSEKLIAKMGFDMDAIHKVISSGQAARQWLEGLEGVEGSATDTLAKELTKNQTQNRWQGKKLVFWGFDDDSRAIDGLGFVMTDDVAEADILLAAGAGRGSLAAYQDDMDMAVARNIPMLCTNPDLVANMPDGSLKICPGTLADYYEAKGGQVVRFGKPAREVYEMCFQEFPSAKKIIGIGDSLDHDIIGAQRAGIDSLFILGGIHAGDVMPQGGEPPQEDKMKRLFTRHGVTPHFVLDSFHL
ncbi:MAG: TIGR01459 family HAD-type hydrolase [Hydrotalea sp.]|nr:TIGR01459 family HAD-type hydrolase [Hydrotalea sp.]